jgi:hypothetical protein
MTRASLPHPEDEPEIPPELAADLTELLRPRAVTPEVERSILAAARARLEPSAPRRLSLLRWLVASAAAAALVLWLMRANPAEPEDLDGDGRVTVLDAFQLARELRGGTPNARGDLDGDGRVDERDVERVFARAVRLDA